LPGSHDRECAPAELVQRAFVEARAYVREVRVLGRARAAGGVRGALGLRRERARDEARVLGDLEAEAERGEGEGVLVLRERSNVRDAGTQRVEVGVDAG
jgi:hypothetical protein